MNKKLFFSGSALALVLFITGAPKIAKVIAQTADELQAQIQALQSQLSGLVSQSGDLPENSVANNGIIPVACAGINFNRNLKFGSVGNDVKCLQAILNQDTATQVATAGAGSPGNESTRFGLRTKYAVVAYQNKYASELLAPAGLTRGTGICGALTRSRLNKLITGGLAQPVCGNGICETNESTISCLQDCGNTQQTCANICKAQGYAASQCNMHAPESVDKCAPGYVNSNAFAYDCVGRSNGDAMGIAKTCCCQNLSTPVCGNGTCETGETAASCPQDCAASTPNQPIGFKQYLLANDASDTVNAANQFAFELYNQYKNTNDNVFFSPYSISSALEMTYEGAKGKTAQEIQSVFHFSADPGVRIPSFAKLYSEINPQNASYQLSTANALWAQKDYPFDPSYMKTISTYYGGQATNLDFKTNAEGSRQTINSWVSSKTNNKIPELFAPGSLDQYTRLVLTNAIYFKGKWETPFDKSLTQQKDFTAADQSKVKCSMMYDEDHYGYAETTNYQAVELPYQKNDLSMIVILPKVGKMDTVQNNISIDQFNGIKNSLNWNLVDVYLPKFKFDTSYGMNSTLSAMGMPTAFDQDNADFTGMYDRSKAGNENLYIGLVIHKAYVDVDEEGTEAAAATGVGMTTGTAIEEPQQPKIFNADHPFIFAIVHNATGSILFLGKVNDPTK